MTTLSDNAELIFASNITEDEIQTIQYIWRDAINPINELEERFNESIVVTYLDTTNTYYFIKPEKGIYNDNM